MEVRRPSWCEWQTDNLFIYREFARIMEGFPFPQPSAEGSEDDS